MARVVMLAMHKDGRTFERVLVQHPPVRQCRYRHRIGKVPAARVPGGRRRRANFLIPMRHGARP